MREAIRPEEIAGIVRLRDAGYSFGAIADELSLGVSAVRKWYWRSQQGKGRQPLGRPASGALSSFGPEVRDWLLSLRKSHPGWGPEVLLQELGRMRGWEGAKLPSRASVARLLKSEGLSKPYSRHGGVQAARGPAPQYPHQRWQIDAKSACAVGGLGHVVLIQIKDVCSRAYVCSFPVLVGGPDGKASAADYQQALRISFIRYGLPDEIQADHGSVLFETRSKSPFPVRLHLWLAALGIRLCFGRFGRPEDQGIVERSHQTLDAHALKGRSFSSWAQLMDALDASCAFLNTDFRCVSLGGKAPFSAFPAARLPRRIFCPAAESDLLSIEAAQQCIAGFEYTRKAASSKTVSLGGEVYFLKHAQARSLITIRFDSEAQMLRFSHPGEQSDELIPVRNLTAEHLMGTGAQILPAPRCGIQLYIPLDANIQQAYYQMRICETVHV